MRRTAGVMALGLASILLSGCANYSAIGAFAKDGSAVAAVAMKDVEVFSAACAELAVEGEILKRAGTTILDPATTGSCQSARDAVARNAVSVSVQLLVKYHESLSALAGDRGWSVAKEMEELGKSVKQVKIDGEVLVTAGDVDKFQKAASSIAEWVVSAMRQRAVRRLLNQDLNWRDALMPLRTWYTGRGGNSASGFSAACNIVDADWAIAESTLSEFSRCRPGDSAAPSCEPLAAAARLINVEARRKKMASCVPDRLGAPSAVAVDRVRLIDEWIAANEELRKKAFARDIGSLLDRLSSMHDQAEVVRKAFD